MAQLLYDGRIYELPDEDAMNVAEAGRDLAQGPAGWLLLGTESAGVRLLVGPGMPIAIHVGDAELLDADESEDQ